MKAEVDFIRNSFRATGKKPEIIVHEHCGESGAIGAAQESLRLWRNGQQTTFIGLEAVRKIEYRTTRNEATRCYFCKNNCLRTFIDIRTEPVKNLVPIEKVTKVPLMLGEQRLIIATCEKGLVEDVERHEGHQGRTRSDSRQASEFCGYGVEGGIPSDECEERGRSDSASRAGRKPAKERVALMQNRKKLRIGIPRVLNIYTYAPLFNGYFESLGVQPENIIYSDYTSSELYRAGASRGAIDPCFPAKIGISHVYNLIQEKHRKKPLNVIFFPMYDVLRLAAGEDCRRECLPDGDRNARNRESGVHERERRFRGKQSQVYRSGAQFRRPQAVRASRCCRRGNRSWVCRRKKTIARWKSGFAALEDYEDSIRSRARQTLDQLEREDRIGIVMLGRPYHHDPGLNHEILDEFQKLGYPIFSQNTLPLDEDLLERLFGDEVRAGVISSPLDITRCVEEFVFVQHQSQGVGGEVHGAASQSCGAGDFQLQMRPRRADLRRCRRDHRAIGHAVFLLQGSRREQAHRVRSEFASRRSIISCGAIARK